MITSAAENREKLDPSYITSWNVKRCSYAKKHFDNVFLSETQNEHKNQPLHFYLPREMKT